LKTQSPSEVCYTKTLTKLAELTARARTDSQSGEPNGGARPGPAHHHQPLSNSNSNSNSNTTTINKDILGSNGNGSSLGNTAGQNFQKKDDDGGRSGSGNGMPKVDFTGLGLYKDQLLKDKAFLEPFMMAAGKIPIPELDAWLNVFNLHLVVTRKLEKDYPDYLSHFSAWWYKGDRTKKPPTLQEIKSVSKNTQQSKSLLAKYDTPA
jgi:hypothetical protein